MDDLRITSNPSARSLGACLALAACIGLSASCTKIDPLFCSDEKPCTDPARPYCDRAGEFPASEGVGNTCIPSPFDAGVGVDGGEGVDGGADAMTACQADTTSCADGVMTTCDSDGTVEDTTPCALGCHAQEARCNDLDPSNGLAPHLDLAADATDIVLTDGAVIDTTSGSVTNGNGSGLSVSSGFDDAGRPVGIFVIRAKSFRAGDVTVRGDRALAIVSDGDVIIEGVLSVSADMKENGPGALPGAGCTGAQGTGADGEWSGGGGGGFGTTGGRGGNAAGHQGGAGGQVAGSTSLEPLRGGCPGGIGGSGFHYGDHPDSAGPGGGGGAVQLVARTKIQFLAGGFVAASGGSGKGYTGEAVVFCIMPGECYPGNGGGSGGGILLEAPELHLTAGSGIAANGAGGHCRGVKEGGDPGQLTSEPAQGADCSHQTFAGSGGNGAAGSVAATSGGGVLGDGAHGGGGGGGAGRIRVNLPLGTTFDPPGTAVVSPTATVGGLSVR